MYKLLWPFLWVTLPIVLLDQITKYWIRTSIELYHKIEVIPAFFDIVHVRNTGSAFGLLANWDSPLRNIFFYVIGVIAAGMLFSMYKKATSVGMRICIAAVLAGAIGNILDRIFLGSVVDFLSLRWYDSSWRWPAFNVADIAISCSVIILLIFFYREEKNKNKQD